MLSGRSKKRAQEYERKFMSLIIQKLKSHKIVKTTISHGCCIIKRTKETSLGPSSCQRIGIFRLIIIQPPYLLLLLRFDVALLWDWLNSFIGLSGQCFSSQGSNVSVIYILFTLQFPKKFRQPLLIYFPHHLPFDSCKTVKFCLS